MNFNSVGILVKKAETLIVENSTVILTGVGVVGTVTTAVMTGQASFKAAELINVEEERLLVEDSTGEVGVMDSKDKVKLVWHLYLPAVGVGTTTVGAIVFANRISSKRAAALAAAYGISEKAYAEYKEKVVQHMGNKKEDALRSEIAQDRVNLNPVDNQIILVGSGDVLCYDSVTGRYFKSTMETIKKAENTVNYEIIHHMYASLSSFYDAIGLPPTSYSDNVGWNTENALEVSYTTTLSSDGQPCIVIDFKVAPVTGYEMLY